MDDRRYYKLLWDDGGSLFRFGDPVEGRSWAPRMKPPLSPCHHGYHIMRGRDVAEWLNYGGWGFHPWWRINLNAVLVLWEVEIPPDEPEPEWLPTSFDYGVKGVVATWRKVRPVAAFPYWEVNEAQWFAQPQRDQWCGEVADRIARYERRYPKEGGPQ